MLIVVREISSRKELKIFIYLPQQIHRDHEEWIPPLYSDEWSYFNPRKNKSFSHCHTTMALAWKGNQAVGRIMGIINPHYNEIHQERNARFCYMECYPDIEIAEALLNYVSDWSQRMGMSRLVGPLGFSDKDPQGCMIEGHDELPAITTSCNFPWMKDFYEQLGLHKEVDLVSYKIPLPDKMPESFERVSKRVIESNDYAMHEFRKQKELRPWIIPVLELVNLTFTDIYGFVPLDSKEMEEIAARYIPILNPRFVKIITNQNNEVVAFIVSIPELSQGIKKAGGRLYPFGWYHILRESKHTRMLTLLLGAIKDSYRGKGLDTLLAIKLFQSARQAGIQYIDSHLILETNSKMRSECERVDGKVYKCYRIYFKTL